MALQGTLDTFALPDVLRLLAATGKAGRLRVTGDRGSGSLWVDNGIVDAGEVNVRGVETTDLVEMLYQLLRFSQGSFTFDGDARPNQKMNSIGVDDLIAQSEVLLADWRELERVVPVTGSVLTLATKLSVDDVVIDAAGWQVIACIGSGSTVAEIGKSTGMGEIEALRAIKGLIESDLAVVTEPSTEFVIAETESARRGARTASAAAQPRTNPVESPSVDASRPSPSATFEPIDFRNLEDTPAAAEAVLAEEPKAEPAPAVTNRFAPMGDSPSPAAEPAPASAADPAADPAPKPPARAGFSGSWESASDLAPTPPPLSAQGPRSQAFAPLDDLYVDDRAGANGSFGDSTMPGPSSTELSNGLATMPLSQEPAKPAPSAPSHAAASPFGATQRPTEASDATDGDPSEIARQLASLSPRAAKAVAAAAKATTNEERDAALATIEAEDQNINRGLLLKFLGTVDG